MKARKLKKLLNDTGYTVSHRSDCICIGSSMCHNLISVDKKTLKLKYALDTFHKGREAISHEELEFIWDKLEELIKSGEIQDIINGNDEITPEMIPVFYVEDGEVIKEYSEACEWPNMTHSGDQIYNNTHFKTIMEAIEYGINDNHLGLKWALESLEEIKEKLLAKEARIYLYGERIRKFEILKSQELSKCDCESCKDCKAKGF